MCKSYSLILYCRNKTVKLIRKMEFNLFISFIYGGFMRPVNFFFVYASLLLFVVASCAINWMGWSYWFISNMTHFASGSHKFQIFKAFSRHFIKGKYLMKFRLKSFNCCFACKLLGYNCNKIVQFVFKS